MDGASSGDDAGDAVGRQGDVPQQHASMDGEVVHALQAGITAHVLSRPAVHCKATTLLVGLLLCLVHTLRHPVGWAGQRLLAEAMRGGDDGRSGLPALPAL